MPTDADFVFVFFLGVDAVFRFFAIGFFVDDNGRLRGDFLTAVVLRDFDPVDEG